MESQYKDTETKTVEEATTSASIDTEVAGLITPATPPSDEPSWQEWVAVIREFISKAPEQVASFFAENKKPLTNIVLISAAAITVYITLTIVDAIDNVPLIAPILELIGLGYSVWFIFRYLLKASTRQELFAELNSFIEQISGDKSKGV